MDRREEAGDHPIREDVPRPQPGDVLVESRNAGKAAPEDNRVRID